MNNDHPLVSICVATYNHEKYISECIESIVSQSYNNIEIIVSDDDSRDGTVEILNRYKELYPQKIKIITSSKNEGVTKNCNKANSLASGKYIAWFAGDDIMLPNKIHQQVKYMEQHQDCSVLYHNLEVFNSVEPSATYYFNDKHGKYEGNIDTLIKHGAFCGGCSMMVRVDKNNKIYFNERITVASDWLYYIDTLSSGGKICYLDEVLARYRRHNDNVTKITNKISQNDLDHMNICALLLQKYPDKFSIIQYRNARNLIGLRHKLPYFKTLWLSFRISPSIKALIGLCVATMTLGKVKL